MRLVVLVMLAALATIANANTVTLYCEGVTRGSNIQDSQSTKVIELDLKTKLITRVLPAPTACFLGKLQRKSTPLFTDSTDFSCLSDFAESYLMLSRYDFRLKEITRFIGKDNGKDLFWEGDFVCYEKSKKL